MQIYSGAGAPRHHLVTADQSKLTAGYHELDLMPEHPAADPFKARLAPTRAFTPSRLLAQPCL